METGLSFIKGAFTNCAFSFVKCICLNLSIFAPVFTPHQSVANANSFVVRLITNSPCSFNILYEYLSGLTEI